MNDGKIDKAIKDTKSRLDYARENLMLLQREVKVLKEQLDTLEIIRDEKPVTRTSPLPGVNSIDVLPSNPQLVKQTV